MIDKEFTKLGLYKHNADSYRKVRSAYNRGERVVGIVHATGTGKTYNALQLALDNKNKKVLFVAPSHAIIEQVKETIKESGLSLEKDFPNLKFITYHAISRKGDKELAKLDVDLLVLDEFHHLGAPVWGSKVNTIIHTHPNMKIFGMTAYTIRGKGTPYERDMAKPGGNELFSDKIVSTYDLLDAMCDGVLPIPNYKSAYLYLMDDVLEIESIVINSKRINDENKATYLKMINDCKDLIYKSVTAQDLIRNTIINNGKYIFFCPLGNGKIYDEDDNYIENNAINEINNKLTIIISKIPEAKAILYETTSDLDEYGKLNRNHFSNNTDFWNRDVSNYIRIMLAKNQYNEGVHAKGVNGVFLGRRTKSELVYYEQIGRALSAYGNIVKLTKEYESKTEKELISIAIKQDIDISKCNTKEEIIERLLAPIIIDLAGNIEFIKGLKERLITRLEERKQRGIPSKITKELVERVFDIEILNEDLYKVLQDIRSKVGNLTWEEVYDLAKEYYQKNNDLLIPQRFITNNTYSYANIRLGSWINVQRKRYKQNKLTKEQIDKLENIGMVWEVDYLSWTQWYDLAKQYYEKNNDLLILQEFTTNNTYSYANMRLGLWIGRQRKAYKENKLTKEQIEMLENIDMVWEVDYLSWDQWYDLAKEYYEKNNDLLISYTFKTDTTYSIINVRLGLWIGRQRKAYKENKLTKEQIRKLENIGMVWSFNQGQIKLSWEDMYTLANQYYSKNKDLSIPQEFITDDTYYYVNIRLGKWICNQRVSYKNNKLTDEQIKKLDSIGMVWKVNTVLPWNEWYDLAKQYYVKTNSLLVPYDFKTDSSYKISDMKLGNWISRQRVVYKEKRLIIEQMEKLESIGMVWEPKTNTISIKELCNEYNINYGLNIEYLKYTSYKELYCKLMYLIDNNQNYIDDNGKLHHIFYMSSNKIQEAYGISLEELISKYNNIKGV